MSRPSPASGAAVAPRRAAVAPRRAALGLLALLAMLIPLAGAAAWQATPAVASSQGARSVERYDVTVELAQDGTAQVAIDFDFDFADSPGHGPFVTLPLTQEIGEEDLVRSYPVSDVSAESPSGAPANVYLDRSPNWLEIRIGDEDVGDVSGVQRYVLRYTVEGLVNPGAGASGEDEFYWNVIGTDWLIPLRDLTVEVNGPGPVVGTVCFAGPFGGTDPCTSHTSAGSTASFAQDALDAGEPFSIDVAYPSGTFVGAEPIIIDRPRPPAPFAATPWTLGVAVPILLVGGFWIIRRVTQRGRDQQYLGVTPGLTPAPGQEAAVGPARRRTPVTVQFQPPPGVRPGEMGTLADERADPRDVTATIIDLAVRGYLLIEETTPPGSRGRGGDWTLRFQGGPEAGLAGYERELLDSLFATRLDPSLSGIKTTFASAMGRVQTQLYDEVTRLGWFRSNPHSVRTGVRALGIALLVLGGVGTALLALVGWGLVGVSVVLLGLLILVLAGRAPARTAAGTAVLAQTLGFKRYLETAEANQLRFEEGEDLFSRYLPFAIVFGVAERWAGIFEQLARQGVRLAEPTWYVSPYYVPGYFWLGTAHFGSTMSSFSDVATTAIAAPTPGSSGGSGFGGGGFSGGGGGGGGGGGW